MVLSPKRRACFYVFLVSRYSTFCARFSSTILLKKFEKRPPFAKKPPLENDFQWGLFFFKNCKYLTMKKELQRIFMVQLMFLIHTSVVKKQIWKIKFFRGLRDKWKSGVRTFQPRNLEDYSNLSFNPEFFNLRFIA